MSGNHLSGWLDIARRTAVCALKGHDWQDWPNRSRHFCTRCWKDEAKPFLVLGR
jgi:hypothetical protein